MTEASSGGQSKTTAFFFFSLIFFVYLLSYRGVVGSDDEQLFIAVSQNLAFHGRFTGEQLLGNSRIAGQFNGTGISHILVGALAARLLDPTGLGFVQGLLILPVIFSALTGMFVFLFVRDSGYPHRFSLLVAAIFSFTSIAWGFSQTFYRETIAALLLTACLYFGRRWIRHRTRTGDGYDLALFLLTLAGMVLAKAILVFIVPGLLFALLQGRSSAVGAQRDPARLLALSAAVIFAAVLLAGAVIPAPTRYQILRSAAAVLLSLTSRPAAEVLLDSLAALFSPGRGLLFFSPLVFLGLLAGITRGARWRKYGIAAIGSLAILVILEAVVHGTEGWALTWGPRRIVPILPLLVIAGIPLFESLYRSHTRWVTGALALASVASACIQLGGVLVSGALMRDTLIPENGDFYSDRLVWSLTASPIGRTWRALLGGAAPDLAIFKLFQSGNPALAGVLLIVVGLGILLASLGLVRSLTQRGPGAAARLAIPVGILLLASPALLMRASRGDPAYDYGPPFTEAAAYLETADGENAAFVIDFYLSPFWQFALNHNGHGHIAWLSLPVPGQRYPPQALGRFQREIAGLAASESVWIVSTNSEFQVSENYGTMEDVLDDYTLESVRGFGGGLPGEAVIVFHFQRNDSPAPAQAAVSGGLQWRCE